MNRVQNYSGIENHTHTVSFFKEEIDELRSSSVKDFSGIFELPENNFLKDPAQIEKDFRDEIERLNNEREENEYYFLLNGKIMEASEVLRQPMEENY